MKQGVLPFQYQQENGSPGMTALSGLMTYLELLHVSGLKSSVERCVGLRRGGQGWTDSQIVRELSEQVYVLRHSIMGVSTIAEEGFDGPANIC